MTMNGSLPKWAAALVTGISIAAGGTAIKTWADTKSNTEKVVECKENLKEHCDKTAGLPGDIRVIQNDIGYIKEEQVTQGVKLDDILLELRK